MTPSEASLKVLQLIAVPLLDHQQDAVLAWGRAVLLGRVEGLDDGLESTALLYHLNRREFQLAAAEFPKWCRVNGKVCATQWNARMAEQRLFLGM